MSVRFWRLDPRYYQIAVLAGFLGYGLVCLEFDIGRTEVILILAVALISQWIATKLWRLPRYDPKSALISGLSLCLLLRSNDFVLFGVAACLAIFSKFILRWRGKHIFNPTNFALVALGTVCGHDVWISPGQWGHEALLVFLIASLGTFVVNRAARSDVTWAFLAFYAALVVGRSIWLGDPLAIPLHMMSSGGLTLFAFYMISDPKTTPASRTGRILFALLAASLTAFIQFGLYRPSALYIALFVTSVLTPILDALFPKTPQDVGIRPAPIVEAVTSELASAVGAQRTIVPTHLSHRRF